jgi:hypothetical protein
MSVINNVNPKKDPKKPAKEPETTPSPISVLATQVEQLGEIGLIHDGSINELRSAVDGIKNALDDLYKITEEKNMITIQNLSAKIDKMTVAHEQSLLRTAKWKDEMEIALRKYTNVLDDGEEEEDDDEEDETFSPHEDLSMKEQLKAGLLNDDAAKEVKSEKKKDKEKKKKKTKKEKKDKKSKKEKKSKKQKEGSKKRKNDKEDKKKKSKKQKKESSSDSDSSDSDEEAATQEKPKVQTKNIFDTLKKLSDQQKQSLSKETAIVVKQEK